MQLLNLCFLKNKQKSALKNPMAHIHVLCAPSAWNTESDIHIFYFVTSSYTPKYIPMLIFFFNSCLFYFIPFFTHLSLGPGDPDSVPSSVPVDISVIYISVSGPLFSHCCYSVAKSCLILCDPMDCSMPGFPVLHHLLELVQAHVHWVSDAIQPSHLLSSPFSSCPQSFPASGSFQMSQLFTSGGQSIGTLVSASVLPVNIQDWLPSGLTGLILLFKGLSRIFSSTIVRKS